MLCRGQQESPSKTTLPDYDPGCYLCPGNKRAQGDVNPKYDSTFVFVNDYSAVKEEQAAYDGSNASGTKQSGNTHCAYNPTHRLQILNRASSKPSP